MKDILFLVADGNMERLFEGLLPRIPTVSNTAPFSFDILVNPTHDAGNLNDSHEYLRPFIRQYKYAIVVFDHEGCGEESIPAEIIEEKVSKELDRNGWEGRNKVVVIDPELENWIWAGSLKIKEAINWKSSQEVEEWLKQTYSFNDNGKPNRPKEAFESALRYARTPRSSSIYKKIASAVSYKHCTDRAFLELLKTLKEWFFKITPEAKE